MAASPKVFISYRRASSEAFADRLYQRLTEQNFDVYYDKNLVAGSDFQQALRDQVIQRDTLIIILAPETLNNPAGAVQELRIALDRKKTIIPIYMDGYTPANVPDEFDKLRTRTGIFYDGRDFEQVVREVRDALTASSRSRRLTAMTRGMRWAIGAAAAFLTLVFTFLALLSEEWRNDAFYKLGIYTATPDQTATFEAAASVTALAMTALPTDTPSPTPTDMPPPTATESPSSLTPTLTQTAAGMPSNTPVPPTPIPSLAPTQTLALSATPAPPTLTTAPVTGGTITLTVFRDEDSFTLYVPQTETQVSLAGLEYRVTLLDGSTVSRRLDKDFAAFLGMPFGNIGSLNQAVCFRLLRTGGTRPVPQACQSGVLLLSQEIALADVFWRDRSSGLDRTVLVYRDGQLTGACGPEPQCALNWPLGGETAAASPALTPTPGYPCEGTILVSSGGFSPVKVSPLRNAPATTPVQQGSAIQILARQNSDGINWYQIDHNGNTGWIATDLVDRSDLCPR